jgi:hypothetical protein
LFVPQIQSGNNSVVSGLSFHHAGCVIIESFPWPFRGCVIIGSFPWLFYGVHHLKRLKIVRGVTSSHHMITSHLWSLPYLPTFTTCRDWVCCPLTQSTEVRQAGYASCYHCHTYLLSPHAGTGFAARLPSPQRWDRQEYIACCRCL